MSENINLSLSFEAAGARGEGGGEVPVATIYVDSACSYLKDSGAPVITAACRNTREFETEAKRLKDEIDAVVSEARLRFGADDEAVTAAQAREAAAKKSAQAAAAKQPLSIGTHLRVRDRMTRDVKTLKPNDEILVAEELMKVGSFRHVVVVNDAGTEVEGVLSHSDICFNALAWNLGEGRTHHDRMVGKMAVKQVMQSSVTTISPDAFIAEAAKLMAAEKISCLPVTENGRLVGILTTGDFLAMWSDALFASAEPTAG